MPLPSRRSAKSLPVLSVTKNAACIARSSRRRTWLTPRPQAVLLPPHRPAQDPRRPRCLRSPALPLHRPRTPLSQAKGAARMALLASVPTAVKSATSKPTESQYLPLNSSARVRFRISDLKKRRSHEPVGRERPAVLTRPTCVALFGLLAKKLFLLARHSQWGAWTCDWNFNIQSHCSETRHQSVKKTCACIYGNPAYASHMLSIPTKAAISKLLFLRSSLFVLQHRELSLRPSGILSASCLVTPQSQKTNRDFYADLDDFYRLCPMLNGTWKPEDRPDGQGDSSFGAVPAALTL
jgi:hypothetical protein